MVLKKEEKLSSTKIVLNHLLSLNIQFLELITILLSNLLLFKELLKSHIGVMLASNKIIKLLTKDHLLKDNFQELHLVREEIKLEMPLKVQILIYLIKFGDFTILIRLEISQLQELLEINTVKLLEPVSLLDLHS